MLNETRTSPDFAGMAYDAALGRRSWQSFVEAVATAFDAVHAVVAPHMPDRGTGRLNGVSYIVSNRACGTFEGQDLLMERAWRLPRGELSVVQKMGADPFIGKSPFYKTTLKDIDIGHAVHVMFATRQGEVGFFCVTRYATQPVFSDDELAVMRSIVGHLARAIEIEDRIGRPAQLEMFEGLPYGLAVLDRSSRVLRMNALAQQLFAAEDGLHMQLDSLHTAQGRLDVEAFLNLPSGPTGSPEPVSLRIDRFFAEQPLSAMISAVPMEWRDPQHQDGTVLLVLSDPDWVVCPTEATMMGLFRLTQAEARFVRMLVTRRSLPKASAALSISPETARRHLKSVFEKTMTHSQSELIHFLVRQPTARLFNPELAPGAMQRFQAAAE
ncbi:MAG: helix-turn-helix transcriptional regulator [Hyphomicrobiales bacterium]|nr:MAG: helix-turn-helix transcriptional regulator [Hyphomicrobiales bacterium]